MKKLSYVLAVVALGFVMTACQNPGTVGGTIAGGLIGSQFGGGKGKTAATIGGAVVGGLVGNQLIDQRRSDRYYRNYRRWY